MRFLAREVSPDTYVNLMDQYRPCGAAYRFHEINRPITSEEFEQALDTALDEEIHRLDSGVGARFRPRERV